MRPRWHVEQVTVAPTGAPPWRVRGAQRALVAESLDQWGFDDWAWGTPELMSFLRRADYERCELLVARAPDSPEGDPDAVVGAIILELPLVDNTSFASANVWARPGADCRAELLDAALELAAREGRTTFLLETDHPPAGPDAELLEPRSGTGRLPADEITRLAASRGFALEQVERISTFRFPADDGALATLRDEAATHAGPFDVVIHNAGIGGGAPERVLTEDGLERIFQVNALAPYLLTALMPRPRRLVYLTSGLEADGVMDLDDLQYRRRPWNGMQAYSDSKLHDVVLAFAVARLWPEVRSNAVDPGWIRTRLGGPNATDDVAAGADTQVWLATSDDPDALVSGRFLKRRTELEPNPQALDVELQDRLLARLAEETGTPLPR